MVEARIQVKKEWQSGTLHVQGVGEEGNRPYGLAVDIRIPIDVRNWLSVQKGALRSANDVDGTHGKDYLPTVLYVDEGEPNPRVLVGGEQVNHEGGALIELDGDSPSVSLLVGWADDNSLIPDGFPQADGEQDS